MPLPCDSLAVRFGVCLACYGLACLPPQRERIDCANSLPAEQASFAQVKELFQSNTSGQGCAAGNCHGEDVAEKGYRFDEDSALFEALTVRMDSVYAQLASGEMPPPEEQDVLGVSTWSDADLLVVSSWYCNGGFPNE